MTETFIKERKHTLDRQGREGQHRRRLRVPLPLRQRLARPVRDRRATPAATRRSTRSRSTARRRRIKWDLHDLHRLQWFDHRDEGPLRGWRSIHVTDGDHPYMGKWWVPGLAIGYEHSFVHQVADFLEGLATGKPAGPTFRDALETQKICDAVLASAKSGRGRTWRRSIGCMALQSSPGLSASDYSWRVCSCLPPSCVAACCGGCAAISHRIPMPIARLPTTCCNMASMASART